MSPFEKRSKEFLQYIPDRVLQGASSWDPAKSSASGLKTDTGTGTWLESVTVYWDNHPQPPAHPFLLLIMYVSNTCLGCPNILPLVVMVLLLNCV